VDVHPDVAAMLNQFIGERRSGLVFAPRRSKPLSQPVLTRPLRHVLSSFCDERYARTTTIKITEARQDGLNIYYRVFVDGVEKPSLVFVTAPDRTAHGEVALKEWCERNLYSWNLAR